MKAMTRQPDWAMRKVKGNSYFTYKLGSDGYYLTVKNAANLLRAEYRRTVRVANALRIDNQSTLNEREIAYNCALDDLLAALRKGRK